MRVRVLDGAFSVCRLPADAPIGELLLAGSESLWSVVRRADETSVVCPVGTEPAGAVVEGPWRAIEVIGPLEFSMIGVLASLAAPLADAEISIFVLSTFDTDVLLVASDQLERAIEVLIGAGQQLG